MTKREILSKYLACEYLDDTLGSEFIGNIEKAMDEYAALNNLPSSQRIISESEANGVCDYFMVRPDSSSATMCMNCGKEKMMHIITDER